MANRNIRARAGAVLLTLALAVLGGCGKSSSEPATSATPAKESAPQEIRLAYFANLTHAQAVLGMASGDFEKAVAPSKIKTRLFNAGPSLIEAMRADEVDIGYVGPGPAVAGFVSSGGKGLKVICGAAANGVSIVVGKDSGISSLPSLAGKRLATPQLANTQDLSARHYLKETLKVTDLGNVLPVANADQVSMMKRGQIDAAWVPEPWGARLVAEAGGRLIGEEKDLWPDGQFATTIVVASPKFMREHPETVRKLLAVHRNWTLKLQQDPAGQLPQLKSALLALTKKELPPGVLDQAITRVKFTDDPIASSIASMAKWSYELGFAKQPPDLTGMVDTTFTLSAGK